MSVRCDAGEFQRWLESQPDGKVFGPPLDVESMPMTHYLRGANGMKYLWSCVLTLAYLDAAKNYDMVEEPLPDWAVAFVSLCSYEREDVTKEMALRVLAICRR